METLFRFNVVRDASKAPDEIAPIDLGATTQFQRDAAAITPDGARTQKLVTLAHTFIESPSFVGSIKANPLLGRLDAAANAVEDLLDADTVSRNDLRDSLKDALEAKPSTFLEEAGLPSLIENLGDSVLAIKLSPADHQRPLARLATVLRAYHLVKQYEEDEAFPRDTADLQASLRRSFKIPDAVLPARPAPAVPGTPSDGGKPLRDLAAQHDQLTAAINELRAIRPSGYSSVAQTAIKGVLPPEKFRPTQLFASELAIRQANLAATASAASAIVGHAATEQNGPSALAALAAASPFLKTSTLAREAPGVDVGRGARIALTGRPDFTPVMQGVVGLRLSQAAQSGLSQGTTKLLAQHGLDVGESVARNITQLTAERRRTFEQAQALARPMMSKTYRRVGGTNVAILSGLKASVFGLSPGELVATLPVPAPPPSVPTTHATFSPSGLMDLLLVKQQLKGYEMSDVSHIANMLKGESTERVLRTRLETETFLLNETERTEATETSLETTDRFEMKRESELAAQEETSAKGSVNVKGKYGPSVEIQVSGDVSWDRKTQHTERASTDVARQVTQKASEKVTERVLTRETIRINKQVEDTDRHTFDNSLGAAHISGVYQWVTKVYEAQVFNYGPRTVYDIMVPEPGAFLLASFQQHHDTAVELEKPAPFDIQPANLSEDNYQFYVALYGATDVKPPPEPFVTETYDFNTGGEDEDQEFTNSTRIAIPDGYAAVRGTVGQVVSVWDDWAVDVVLGQRAHRFNGGGWVWSSSLDEETGSIPFAMVTDKVGDVAVAVEVICEATPRALNLWRAETHGKLVNAYRLRLSEYEAKLADLQAQAPPQIQSGPEARNHALMLDEVKRACISILSEQRFELFNAMGSSTDGTGIEFGEVAAEGPYVRFFEQAFEWENVSWVTYPYFWGRRGGWLDKIGIEDDDADFQAFLKAGYLRVQVPIRPGFAEAVDHFRLMGMPWLGGPLPSITDDLYLPIAQELAERLDRPGDEVAVGDPWEVRVPTTLVRLRSDDKLPVWTKQPDGSWKGS
jgi:hypothetical protein